MDIIQAATSAYLNVLRAKNIERIQKENLKLTRENLERARIRVDIGVAGPEEVYRWESQIAGSRSNLLKAQSVALDTISAMNNILNTVLRSGTAVHPAVDHGLIDSSRSNRPTVVPAGDRMLTMAGRFSPGTESIPLFICHHPSPVSSRLPMDQRRLPPPPRRAPPPPRLGWLCRDR